MLVPHKGSGSFPNGPHHWLTPGSYSCEERERGTRVNDGDCWMFAELPNGVNRQERATISLLRYDKHPAGNSGNNVNERAGLTGRNVNRNAHINSN